MRDPLPSIEIPLLPGDPAITVELQPMLDRCYDSGNYARRVQYREWTVSPPLSAEQAAWAEKVLREQGAKAS